MQAQHAPAPVADSLTGINQLALVGPRPADALFAGEDALEFTLTTPLRNVLKDRGETPVEHPAELRYTDPNLASVTLPVKLKVRGNFRRRRTNCSFPPLLVNFPKKKARNTVYEHQDKLKLITHCQTDEYVLREYLVYKLYNLLTDVSFRARLARVTYADSAGKSAPETHWAFWLEDEEAMAKRNRTKLDKRLRMNMGRTDSLTMATVAVFEYMIGNTDWSVPYRHNIRFVADSAHRLPMPIPYDFDHAGIVDAHYAQPAAQLNIESVRDRLYRGPAYPPELFQQVFEHFNRLKPHFYALYQQERRLNPSYVRRTLNYLDDFFTLINKPASVKAVFLNDVPSPAIVIKGSK